MSQSLRVMSYNILFGGHDAHGDRMPLIAEIVNDARPDILALCECQGFLDDGGARRDAFCNAVGMDGAFVHAASGNHVGLLYRAPLTPTATRTIDSPMHHGLVCTTFRIAGGRELDVVATHLNPYSSVFRVGEAQVVLSRLQPRSNAIVMGDFNSLPIGTATGLAVHRLLDLRLQPDTEVARYFAAAGLIDLLAQRRIATPTYPTSLESKRDDFGDGVRLDYIMASRSLTKLCTSAAVIDTSLAQRASDHLPVVAEFTLL